MANEIALKFASFALDSTNGITVGAIEINPRKTVKTTAIPKTHGSISEEAKIESLEINVEGDILGSDYDDLRTKRDSLKAALNSGKQKFTIDDDRYVIAQLSDFSFSFATIRTLGKWSATFIAHYPFEIAETASVSTATPTSGVGYTINNAGNAPARVKIKVTAPVGGITDNIQIENTTVGELCKYRGTVAAGKVLEIDNRYDTDDFEVLNDGVSDFEDFEGDFITLNPGNNTIKYTGTPGAVVEITHRPQWYA